MQIPATGRRTAYTAILLAIIAIIIFTAGQPAHAQTLPTLSWDETLYSVVEAPGLGSSVQVVVQINLSAASTDPVSVEVFTEDFTAFAGEDYVYINRTVRFPAGTTTKTLNLTILETVRDGLLVVENTELFNIWMQNPSNATIGSPSTQIEIVDEDQTEICISYPEYILEGESLYVTLTVEDYIDYAFTTLIFDADFPPIRPTPVTQLGTPGEDYTQFRFRPHMEKLERSKQFEIQTIDDNEAEGFERLGFSWTRGGLDQDITSCGSQDNAVIIVDDDTRPGVMTTSDWTSGATLHNKTLFVEEGSQASYDIWLSRQPTAPVEVTISTNGDRHLSGDDVTATFTPDDWIKRYTVNVEAESDNDSLNGVRAARHHVDSDDPAFSKDQRMLWSEMDTTADGQGRKIYEEDPDGSGITVTAHGVPYRHDGKPYWIELEFSEPIRNGYASLMAILNSGTHSTYVHRLHRIDGTTTRWAARMMPTAGLFTSLVIHPTDNCGDTHAICSRDGDPLENKLVISVAPIGKGDAKHPPGETDRPMVTFQTYVTSPEHTSEVRTTLRIYPATTEPVTFQIMTFDLPDGYNVNDLPLATRGQDYVHSIQTRTVTPGSVFSLSLFEVIDDDVAETDEVVGLLMFNLSENADFQGELNFNHNMVRFFTIQDDD